MGVDVEEKEQEIETRVYMKYEKLYGALPIRLVEDPTDRMLHEGDVIKFEGAWKYLKGFYRVKRTVQFMRRKATYVYNGESYPLILGPGKWIMLQMDDLIPITEDHITQYRVGIPDGILVILAYPKNVTRFKMDNPIYSMDPNVSNDKSYIGVYTSEDSPFDAPRLEIANVIGKEENVYIIVKNDSPDYRKAVLNLYVNKIEIEPTKPVKEYMPFYHSELVL